MKKVLVAMSGGVDSSVAAAMLKQRGYFVVGGYMKNFSRESWEGVIDQNCPWEEDVEILKKVCQRIGIELRVFNFEKEYKEKIIEYFFAEYAAGRTPNPDVMCNSEIKFGIFLDKARELGFDYIATGHYARINNPSHPPLASRGGVPPLEVRGGEGELCLLKGVDPNKDQSYFLYRLNQEQLSRALFPTGEYTKSQVRELARKFNLPNADRKDSQGLCFIGHINLREFLKQRIPERVGEVVTTSGQVLGQHSGAAYYTIGQRHGLGIGGGTPYYVAQKDILNNKVIVTDRQYDDMIHHTTLEIGDAVWISGREPEFPLKCSAKIRYRQTETPCKVFQNSVSLNVEFESEQFAAAPGQSVVFYDGERVLGGGIIETTASG